MVVLHEDAAIVSSVLADVRVHLFGGGLPALGRLRVAAQTGEPCAAVSGDPAEQLRGREVPGLAAHLPDPAVGLTPVLERRVHLAREDLPEAVVQAIARARMEPTESRNTPDIVLPVAPGVVADPHRPRALVAGEVIERLLVGCARPSMPYMICRSSSWTRSAMK